ncbi:hypothetical protein B0A48_03758 [Cryoendolithus antarcticus]|uniref:Uncharacterized protein n=1 Tax=Cryoendolithus antarcticus TaxID=1507870 RepID=A0A1V8TGU1_9PEZI|nr:hypothetical protein B0A48_03758 [Cryoendolithus antarcticus]
MPSHLRLESSFAPFEAQAIYQVSPSSPPAKKQRMSLTRTYAVASTARSKLGREASRGDHNLRRLVGHANLLDTLMVELADAEREQEAWFNHSVRKASTASEPRHIQWVDSIAEQIDEDDEEDSDSDSDAGSDIYDEDEDLFSMDIPKNLRQAPVVIESAEIDEEDYDDEDDEHHALVRVPSKHSPPELLSDDSDSEDESTPSSPEAPALELSEKERQAITNLPFFSQKSGASIEDYIMQDQQPLIAAY